MVAQQHFHIARLDFSNNLVNIHFLFFPYSFSKVGRESGHSVLQFKDVAYWMEELNIALLITVGKENDSSHLIAMDRI